MSHFSFSPLQPGDDWSARPQPRRADLGEWPRFEAALAVVNRDLAATLPDEPALVLMLSPAFDPDWPDQLYVARADGTWDGNAVHPQNPEQVPEPEDEVTALAAVAIGAQETLTELRWQVWPECPYHHLGVHVRPAGSEPGWGPEIWPVGAPAVWWCRGQGGHDLAPVGELGAAVPGKQRREARRRDRRDRRG